jgi:chromate transporter
MAIKTFVDGVTAAAIGALSGAVVLLAGKSLTDIPTILIAATTIGLLLRFKRIQEPYIIIGAAVLGWLIKLINHI